MLVNPRLTIAEEIDALAPRLPKAKARRKSKLPKELRASEALIEGAILSYCQMVGIFAAKVPNELHRPDPRTGRVLKRPGVRSGFPDLVCGERGVSLYVEVKNDEGELSQEQIVCHADMRRAGLRVVVVRSVEEAKRAFRDAGLIL